MEALGLIVEQELVVGTCIIISHYLIPILLVSLGTYVFHNELLDVIGLLFRVAIAHVRSIDTCSEYAEVVFYVLLNERILLDVGLVVVVARVGRFQMM